MAAVRVAAAPKALSQCACERLLSEATTKQKSGQLQQAAQCAELVLKHNPDHPEALLRLGIIYAQLGLLTSAVELLRKGISVSPAPGPAEGYNNLGTALHSMHQSEEAILAYTAALKINPQYTLAFNNLGIALNALGDHEGAIKQYRSALAIDPKNADLHCNLGIALHAIDRKEEALVEFRMALDVEPDFPQAHENLGHLFGEMGRLVTAAKHYQTALKAQPGNAELHVSLGKVLHMTGRIEEAGQHFETANLIGPELSSATAGLGIVALERGQLEEARRHAERAIAIDPQPSHYYLLARVTKLRPSDPHFSAMLKLADASASFPDPAKIDIAFAAAKALSDIGENERAFNYLLTANALKRRYTSYNEADVFRRLERLREIFDEELFDRFGGSGNPSSTPIFIVGMPRSGSTLVEQILAGHPDIFAGGELNTFAESVRFVGLSKREQPYPQLVSLLTSELSQQLGAQYLSRLRAQTGSLDGAFARITDKMLANFIYVGLIHLALPNARIIHMRRNPIDICLSCFSIHFAKLPFTYDLGELGRYYRGYAALMDHWHNVLPRGKILTVQYESVVDDVEAAARRVVAHCGLPWHDRCLQFHEVNRPVRTASALQVRQPIYRDSIKRWRPNSEILRPLLDALGNIECG